MRLGRVVAHRKISAGLTRRSSASGSFASVWRSDANLPVYPCEPTYSCTTPTEAMGHKRTCLGIRTGRRAFGRLTFVSLMLPGSDALKTRRALAYCSGVSE